MKCPKFRSVGRFIMWHLQDRLYVYWPVVTVCASLAEARMSCIYIDQPGLSGRAGGCSLGACSEDGCEDGCEACFSGMVWALSFGHWPRYLGFNMQQPAAARHGVLD